MLLHWRPCNAGAGWHPRASPEARGPEHLGRDALHQKKCDDDYVGLHAVLGHAGTRGHSRANLAARARRYDAWHACEVPFTVLGQSGTLGPCAAPQLGVRRSLHGNQRKCRRDLCQASCKRQTDVRGDRQALALPTHACATNLHGTRCILPHPAGLAMRPRSLEPTHKRHCTHTRAVSSQGAVLASWRAQPHTHKLLPSRCRRTLAVARQRSMRRLRSTPPPPTSPPRPPRAPFVPTRRPLSQHAGRPPRHASQRARPTAESACCLVMARPHRTTLLCAKPEQQL